MTARSLSLSWAWGMLILGLVLVGCTGDDGQPYKFKGQKDIRWLHAQKSFSELPGDVTDHMGKVVATCKTRFDIKSDLFQFALSWKPA